MTDEALIHALALASTVIIAFLLFWKRARERQNKASNLRPFLPDSAAGSGPGNGGDDQFAVLQQRYARKTRFRMGVLGMCLLALGCYLGLENRALTLIFLGAAGLCQYGAYRQSTTTGLVTLLQQSRMPGAGNSGSAERQPETGGTAG